MSRRKQARPIRVYEDEEINAATGEAVADTAAAVASPNFPTASANDGLDGTVDEEVPEILMCPRCQEQFTEVAEFLAHKSECDKKAIKHDDPAHSDPEDMVVSEDDEEEEEAGGKRMERMRRHRQDAANNNSVDEASPEDNPMDFPFPVTPAAQGHVTLEALQNTKVAVAQFAATALANNVDNEVALQELAVLQSTLFTLQHQQVFQLQLINQLQHQLQIDRTKEDEQSGSPGPSEHERESSPIDENSPTPKPEPSPPAVARLTPATPPHVPTPPPPPLPLTRPEVTHPSNLPLQMQAPMCSISASLASTIITHGNDPPTAEEPNTLNLLQKRAQEVLDNASQGLLATNLADELAFRKSKGSMSPYDSKGRNEPFFKHRCRYCGKVFGSDSALQIHIRSHTGERPYKCNVCGSRFTTKGNLKVHFQRHSSKFPHIKMNPNPVPEHLDKYHPPLLAQLGQQPSLSPGGPGHPPHLGFPSAAPFPPTCLPHYRPTNPPSADLLNSRIPPCRTPPHRLLFPQPFAVKREDQEAPADLRKPPSPRGRDRSCSPKDSPKSRTETGTIEAKQQPQESPNAQRMTPKQEPNDNENEQEAEQARYGSPNGFELCSNESRFSNEDAMERRSPDDRSEMQDEPENLSSKANLISAALSIAAGQRLPANFPFYPQNSPASSTSSGSLGQYPTSAIGDITKDPALYTNLLPRPGSNDNSWESLIEVSKTSETIKLQRMVDNIEHILADPNQCVVCQRVLSCKSALQMHYRTHTGERPFKCKICGRAFTTKGNLKTHMGVHRAKPPMRLLHQCPVCHKKYNNASVLQQHIRLHTGEPTDLTPEQIQAAEVRDYPSSGGFSSLANSMNPFLRQGFSVPGLSPISTSGLHFQLNERSEQESMDDDDEEDDNMSTNTDNQATNQFASSPTESNNHINPSVSIASFSNSELNGSSEDLSCNRAISPPGLQNGEKSPNRSVTSRESAEMQSPHQRMTSTPVQVPRPPSSQRAGSPTTSDCNSMGALDLTPRPNQNQPIITSPGPSPGPPPSLFSAFGFLPQVSQSSYISPGSLRLSGAAAASLGRGNTTCNLCFKTFACHSALEIHYRSHTKERPFKCSVCDRGFSTKDGCDCNKQRRIQEDAKPWKARSRKPPSRNIPSVFPLPMSPGYASTWMQMAGNMKQHMLTHKIRDMPPQMFENKTPSLSGDDSTPLPPSLPSIEQKPPSDEPPGLSTQPLQPPVPPIAQSHLAQLQSLHDQKVESAQIKREPTETELPLPKRSTLSPHGYAYVEQRGVATRATHVARPAAHPHDAQGYRISAAETRHLLPVPPGSIP
ncbi:homeotic protein spalt-major isoform X1 [Dendroctonus ponderosae]|uniref:homeotic protein spalt-major isoform X1 n=1 Tax=Dendroctonus ponderosae TaxID=77166 RepID=UPI002034E203|nr:homeotic protein spalt-major isoform X1 [Dendroctonus ponderosae]